MIVLDSSAVLAILTGAPEAERLAEEIAYDATTAFPRQALHAWLLGFHHPGLDKPMRFEREWPADFAALVAALRGLNAA